jgi:hypothetical protein
MPFFILSSKERKVNFIRDIMLSEYYFYAGLMGGKKALSIHSLQVRGRIAKDETMKKNKLKTMRANKCLGIKLLFMVCYMNTMQCDAIKFKLVEGLN